MHRKIGATITEVQQFPSNEKITPDDDHFGQNI
jgi:hypothetical protein